MTTTKRANVAGLLFLLGLLGGCGGKDGPGARIVPVTGRVTFKNQAVTAAEIFFIPDPKKGNQGEMGSALLKPDGSFAITTIHAGRTVEGIAPGAYKVTFGLGRRPEKELARYRNVQTTPLEIDVPEEGIEDHLFELK
jgi:hypothetical protein